MKPTDSPGAGTGSPKIVLLIGHFGRGGSERQAYLLARELRNRYGFDAQVWALTTDGEYSEEFEAAGIPTKVLGFRFPRCPTSAVRLAYWISRLWQVTREFRKARVVILLPYTTWPNVVAGLTYRLAGVKLCIWGERSAGLEGMPGPTRFAVRQYRRFIANSSAGVDFLSRRMGIERSRISYVPNGIEEAAIVPGATDWRFSLGLAPGQLLIVKIANITAYKDHATLLRAWKALQDSWSGGAPPLLALAGFFGNKYQDCQEFVAEAGLEATVRFLGSIPDVPALVQAADLAVFSSPAEGMPNGVMECMAAGKAIIATDLPGVRDVMGSNAERALVPPGDADEFARKLIGLANDGETRHILGQANRARIQSEFSVELLADRYLGIFRQELPAGSSASIRLAELHTGIEPNSLAVADTSGNIRA